MTAFQITDLRLFTKNLFMQDTFDSFWVSEATIQTSAALIIEGKIDPAFFAEPGSEADESAESTPVLPPGQAPYRTWGEIRPLCFEWIKGKSLPLHFRIVLRDPSRAEDAAFLNIRYERGQALRVTTGYTAKEFTMDRSDEKLWDEEVVKFFTEQEIELEQF